MDMRVKLTAAEKEIERLTVALAVCHVPVLKQRKIIAKLEDRIKVLEAKQKYLCDCLEAVGVDSSAALQAEPVAAADKE